MNLIKTFFILFSISLILSACDGSYNDKDISDRISLIENDKIGFVLPKHSIQFSDSSKLTITIKKANPNLIFLASIDTNKIYSPLFSITKYIADTIVPMEIVFIEQCVKYNSELLDENSKLIDFGIYDKHGKRYRYKITQPPLPNIYKQMYYFMENEEDSCLYELTIASDLDHFNYSDSLIKSIAETFIFLKK